MPTDRRYEPLGTVLPTSCREFCEVLSAFLEENYSGLYRFDFSFGADGRLLVNAPVFCRILARCFERVGWSAVTDIRVRREENELCFTLTSPGLTDERALRSYLSSEARYGEMEIYFDPDTVTLVLRIRESRSFVYAPGLFPRIFRACFGDTMPKRNGKCKE